MLKDEGAHGVGMALGANCKLTCGSANLMAGLRAMRIMTVAALDESDVHPVAVGPRELCLLCGMAPEAQLLLRLDQYEIHIGGLVRAVT